MKIIKYIIGFGSLIYFGVMLTQFGIQLLQEGFHDPSAHVGNTIVLIIYAAVILFVIKVLHNIAKGVGATNARRTEGTHGISNKKFVDRVIERAQEIVSEIDPNVDMTFKHADTRTGGENNEFQTFFYKACDDNLDDLEENAGISYGFCFTMTKKPGSSCLVEKLRGINDQMEHLAKINTGSAEGAAKFVATQYRLSSKKAAQRNKRLYRAA